MKSIFLFINQSQESKDAQKLLDSKGVNYTPVFSEDAYTTIPSLIYNGNSYKTINQIRYFVNIFPELTKEI